MCVAVCDLGQKRGFMYDGYIRNIIHHGSSNSHVRIYTYIPVATASNQPTCVQYVCSQYPSDPSRRRVQ